MLNHIEVCIDNAESFNYAQQGGATRIELCSALSLGGLTPSAGLMMQAGRYCCLPVHALIRPRQGDFLFNEQDVEIMLADIFQAKLSGLQGVVIGALNADGLIDKDITRSLIKEAGKMDITFHRAIDQSVGLYANLDTIMGLGCSRLLTSGQASSALLGAQTIKDMIHYCQSHLTIMAGAGITGENAAELIKITGVKEVHLSGKTTRPSLMSLSHSDIKMGMLDDHLIPITNSESIRAVSELCY